MRGLVNDAVEIEGSSPSALLNAPTTMSSYSSCQIFGTGKEDKYEAKISELELERRPGSSGAKLGRPTTRQTKSLGLCLHSSSSLLFLYKHH